MAKKENKKSGGKKGMHHGHAYKETCMCALCKRKHKKPATQTVVTIDPEVVKPALPEVVVNDETVMSYIDNNPEFFERAVKKDLQNKFSQNPELYKQTMASVLLQGREKLPDDILLYRMPEDILKLMQGKLDTLKKRFVPADYGDFLDKLISESLTLYLQND